MCGRFTLAAPERIAAAFPRFHFEAFSEYRLPRFNIAPAQDVLAVRNDGAARIEMLPWGIERRINARAETIAAHPIAFRCIIFADGFYEWRGSKPVYFTMRDDRVFAFAGIWANAGGATPCAIVTTEANELVAKTHDRMPAILSAASVDAWLAPEPISPARARELLRPFAAAAMTARDASMRLNDARRDAPDVLVDDDPVQGELF